MSTTPPVDERTNHSEVVVQILKSYGLEAYPTGRADSAHVTMYHPGEEEVTLVVVLDILNQHGYQTCIDTSRFRLFLHKIRPCPPGEAASTSQPLC